MQVATEAKFVGLCSTCNNAATCTYRALRGSDAIFCEMFDDFVPQPSRDGAPVVSAESREETAAEDLRDLPFRGLCVNCAHRDTCLWARADGGVWHCEEYSL